MKRVTRMLWIAGVWIVGTLSLGRLDVSQASSPLGYPGSAPRISVSGPGPEVKTGTVISLPPETWPGESAFPSHNPVFISRVPLSEWSRRFSQNGVPEDFASGIVTASGRVFAVSRSGIVEALDGSDGKSLWTRNLDGPVNAPLILSKRTLYVVRSSPSITLEHLLFYTRTRHLLRGDGSDRIWALSQESGQILWTRALPGALLGSPLLEPHTIALATGSGHLIFLSRLDGHVVVDLPVSGGAFGWASPLDKPDAIYLAQENPPMIDRIGKSPLKVDWRFALSETRTYDRFFIGGLLSTPTGVVSVFREKGSGRLILVSIDGATGKILWTLSLSETSADVPEEIVNMVSSDGVLYVPSPEKGDILAVSMDGQLLWKTHVGDHPHTGGTAIGRLLFIPLPSGHIVALDRLNGQKVHEWVGKAPLGPLPLPVIGSMVFLADRRGVIQAMDLSSLGEKADLLSRTSFLKPKDPSMDIVGGRPGE